MLAAALAGLIISAIDQFWTWRGANNARYHKMIDNLALYWYFVAASAVVVVATLYVSP